MTIAPGTRMTLDDFLALPEDGEKPYLEFVNGEVVPKPLADRAHGRVVARLSSRLDRYLEGSGEAFAETDVCHVSRDEERIFLPDISVTLNERVPEGTERAVSAMPDLAVEVLSPTDRPGRVAEKVDLYLRNGVRLVWVVDPDDRSVTVHRPGEPVHVATAGEQLDARPLLAAFELALDDLFKVLD